MTVKCESWHSLKLLTIESISKRLEKGTKVKTALVYEWLAYMAHSIVSGGH